MHTLLCAVCAKKGACLARILFWEGCILQLAESFDMPVTFRLPYGRIAPRFVRLDVPECRSLRTFAFWRAEQLYTNRSGIWRPPLEKSFLSPQTSYLQFQFYSCLLIYSPLNNINQCLYFFCRSISPIDYKTTVLF